MASEHLAPRLPASLRSHPRKKPNPKCKNCNGRGCMGCVMREYEHDCIDDCPSCCSGLPWVASTAIEVEVEWEDGFDADRFYRFKGWVLTVAADAFSGAEVRQLDRIAVEGWS